MQADAGTEFMAKMLQLFTDRNIKKKVVALGATVERSNQFIQRKFMGLVKQHRGGTVDKLLKEAIVMVNNHTSRITKGSPIENLERSDRELAALYNSTRQVGKQVAKKLKVGDAVRYLLKARKADAFYKSYKNKFSPIYKISKITGGGYVVNGKSYARDRLMKVKPTDQKSVSLINERVTKKKTPLQRRLDAATTAKEKKAVEREHFKAEPRRSGRSGKKLWSERN